MPPRRRVRATASPSPAPSGRGSTPARGAAVRTPLPAKYSTSYGSSITQLPDRSTVGGGGSITQAAAEVFTKVKRDNIAAEARRQVKRQERQAGRGRAGSRRLSESPQPPVIQPTIEVDEVWPESDGASREGGSEYEYQDESVDGSQRSSRGSARKRSREDDEAKEAEERERKERAAQLRRERAAEARKLAAQKRLEAEAAAKEKAERERLQQQAAREAAAREEAAKAAMPPPPQPKVPPAPEITMTPATSLLATDGNNDRPASARSFIEERNLFLDAKLRTPVKELPTDTHLSGPSARSTKTAPSKVTPPETPHAPSMPSGPLPSRGRERLDDREPSVSTDDEPPEYASRPEEVDLAESEPRKNQQRARRFSLKDLFSPQLLVTTILGAFFMLHLIRFGDTFVRPDLFRPDATLKWYGWRDWQSNIGQLFPSPLLHPLGVLTQDQYTDLKRYLDKRTSTTEAAVENLNSILPKVISVQKWRGRIVVSDEFWNALKDRIQHDDNILSLDSKARISDKHWKSIQQRLKEASLLGKPITAADVERIVDQKVPDSWAKWVQKNKQKVNSILGTTSSSNKGDSSSGTGETVVTREEFIKEVTAELAKNKKEIEDEMSSLRKELHGLVHELKATASSAGMSKSEVTSLVQKLISKEIGNRQLQGGSKAQVDTALRRRINYFSLGNNGQVDLSMTSPTWEPAKPLVGSKEFRKSRPPRYKMQPFHALTDWSEPGDCWCAAADSSSSPSSSKKKSVAPPTLSVDLAGLVIPQYLVLEHIDPLATTDPGAMPKEVEVWARFDDPARRARVRDWTAAADPGAASDPANGPLLAANFAKIGGFTYEHRPRDEGVFVHRLSDNLQRMGAAASAVLVRAVSNYGAPDHTCFYRVRLYGEPVEPGAPLPEKEEERTKEQKEEGRSWDWW